MTRWCCDSSKRTATRMSVTIQMRRRCTRQLAKGRYLVAWLLLKRGADPQGKLRFGKTAMDLAEAGGQTIDSSVSTATNEDHLQFSCTLQTISYLLNHATEARSVITSFPMAYNQTNCADRAKGCRPEYRTITDKPKPP